MIGVASAGRFEQAARHLRVSAREYLELEAGECSPTFETYDRICKPFGWPPDVRSKGPAVTITRMIPGA